MKDCSTPLVDDGRDIASFVARPTPLRPVRAPGAPTLPPSLPA